MKEKSSSSVLYRDDVKQILNCSDYAALQIIKKSGAAIKIGHKLAVPSSYIYSLLQAQERARIEYR